MNLETRFLMVGAWNTLFGYVAFAGLYGLLSETAHYLVILTVAHILAVMQSFMAHRRWVFCSVKPWLPEFLRYNISTLGLLVLGAILLPLFVKGIGLPVLVAQAIATMIGAVAAFVVHRLFSFETRRSTTHAPEL